MKGRQKNSAFLFSLFLRQIHSINMPFSDAKDTVYKQNTFIHIIRSEKDVISTEPFYQLPICRLINPLQRDGEHDGSDH